MVFAVPVLNVLVYASLAALLAGLGVVPFAGGRSPNRRWVGLAYAAAGGMMLGCAHLLMTEGVAFEAWQTTRGVAAGVAYAAVIRVFASIDDLDEIDEHGAQQLSPGYGYKVFLQGSLHAAVEGVAIGVAMVLNLRVGIFLALVFALHNVAEGMALTDTLRTQELSLRRCAALAVVAKVAQPMLALAVFSLLPVLSLYLPAGLGFAAGGLSFLVLTDLLPASYRRAGKLPIACTVSVLAATVVLLEGLFPR